MFTVKHTIHMNTPSTTTPTLRERLANSRFLSFSLLIHAILVPLLATLVICVRNVEPEEIPIGSIAISDEIKIHVKTQDDSRPKIEADQPSGVQITTPPPPTGGLAVITTPVVSKLTVPDTVTLSRDSLKLGSGPDILIKIPGTIPGPYGPRFGKDPSGRITGPPGKPGPTKATEDAVIRALNWLRDHQNKDGSWGLENKGAMTGLALLCFLGHGELCDSKDYGYNVNLGIEWLITNGTMSDGRLAMSGADWGPGNGGVYEHGIATYALAEYYTLTRGSKSQDDRVVELLRKAVSHIVAGQGPDGGWMYRFDKSPGDTSVTGWQIQALKAAQLTGLNLPGVTPALDRGIASLTRVRGPKGGYGYRGPEDRYSLTGIGVLCELSWKGERNPALRRGIEFINDTVQKEQPIKYTHDKADLYAWYYHTNAMLMFGGAEATAWDRRFSAEITGAQSPDGSWPKMNAPGHGNLQNSETLTAYIYRTTLCTLMLEAYYRLTPSLRAGATTQPFQLAAR